MPSTSIRGAFISPTGGGHWMQYAAAELVTARTFCERAAKTVVHLQCGKVELVDYFGI